MKRVVAANPFLYLYCSLFGELQLIYINMMKRNLLLPWGYIMRIHFIYNNYGK